MWFWRDFLCKDFLKKIMKEETMNSSFNQRFSWLSCQCNSWSNKSLPRISWTNAIYKRRNSWKRKSTCFRWDSLWYTLRTRIRTRTKIVLTMCSCYRYDNESKRWVRNVLSLPKSFDRVCDRSNWSFSRNNTCRQSASSVRVHRFSHETEERFAPWKLIISYQVRFIG